MWQLMRTSISIQVTKHITLDAAERDGSRGNTQGWKAGKLLTGSIENGEVHIMPCNAHVGVCEVHKKGICVQEKVERP